MGRLTKQIADEATLNGTGDVPCKTICDRMYKYDQPCDICPINEAINKLAHYEDMEEAGRLIEVVKCSECEHYDTVGCADGCGWCDYWDIGRFTDGYCDKAKLKELEVQNG